MSEIRKSDQITGQYLRQSELLFLNKTKDRGHGDAMPPSDRRTHELEKLQEEKQMKIIGFSVDKNKNLNFNASRCIEYLQTVCDLLVIDGTLYLYNQREGIWDILTEELLGTILMFVMNNVLSHSWKSIYETDVYSGLLRDVPRMEGASTPQHLVAVNNGVYDLKEKVLLPFDSQYYFRNKSPVQYDEDAQCPNFLAAIESIFCGDRELIKVVQQQFGNCFLETCKAEKMFFWIGTGSNGKSLLAEVLTALIGAENISHIPLSGFSDKFGLEGLINKKLNLSAENEMERGALSTAPLKAITSGDTLNVQRKYKTAVSIKQSTKLIFLMNNLPTTLDLTLGFSRKLLVIPFNRIYRSEEMDKHLKEKLLKEQSGILNWTLEGAISLMENGFEFANSKAIQQTTQRYQQDQNPVKSFFQEVLKPVPKSRESRKEILSAYKRWLDGQGLSAKGTDSTQRFWQLLNNAARIDGLPELEYIKVKGQRCLVGYKISKEQLPQNMGIKIIASAEKAKKTKKVIK